MNVHISYHFTFALYMKSRGDLQEKPFQICNGVRGQGLESQHRQHDAQPHWNAQKGLVSAAREEPPVPAVNVPAVNVPVALQPEASRQFCNNHAWMNEWMLCFGYNIQYLNNTRKKKTYFKFFFLIPSHFNYFSLEFSIILHFDFFFKFQQRSF